MAYGRYNGMSRIPRAGHPGNKCGSGLATCVHKLKQCGRPRGNSRGWRDDSAVRSICRSSEDLRSAPGTFAGKLTTIVSPALQDSAPSSGLCRQKGMHMHRRTHTQTNTYINLSKNNKSVLSGKDRNVVNVDIQLTNF